MTVYTIGFTKKTAEEFFERVRRSRAQSVTDIRRHPDTQLSGFAKGRDLAYFIPELVGIPYRSESLLAPSADLLAGYREKTLSWEHYARAYAAELDARDVASALRREDVSGTVLLCSEATAERCHRRLAVEYLSRHWGPIDRIDL